MQISSSKLLVIPPGVQGECYVVQVTGEPPSLKLIYGNSALNGKSLLEATDIPLSPGKQAIACFSPAVPG